MNKINKNVNVNSMDLTSTQKNLESSKEENLKNKLRNGITRQKANLRKVKEWPPINQPGMTDKLSDSNHGKKVITKPLPKSPRMMKSVSLPNLKNKPLPDTPIKTKSSSSVVTTNAKTNTPSNFLSHHSLKLVARNKPLPPVPTKSHTQPQIQSQPQPQIAILTNTLDVGLISKQMKLFKNAINSQDGSQAELLAEQLNKYASDDKNISAYTCREFALNVEKLARPNFNFTPEIKHALVQFASVWIAMKSAQGDAKGSTWDIVINTMALSVQKKSKEWGMEF